MFPYVLIAVVCGIAVLILLVVGLCEAARTGDEQLDPPEPETDWIWPELTVRRDAHEGRTHGPRPLVHARRGDVL